MNASDSALLRLTSVAVGLRPYEDVSLTPDEWERLFTQASLHNVGALVCVALERSQSDIPLTIKLKFAALKQQTATRYAERRRLMVSLLSLWNSAGIETMLLKGFDTCRHYPDPTLRSFGDIDTYNLGRRKEADRLVADHFGVTISTSTHHHSKYTLSGILVENHYDFISRYGNRGNGRMDDLLKNEVGKDRTAYTLDGQHCLLPPPDFAALFLRHMAAHFAADRITVRHLVDWTLFCRDEEHNVDWSKIRTVADNFGFLPFAQALEEICRRHLGLTPHLGGCDAELANRVLNEILVGEFSVPEPPSSKPFRRLNFKWRRLVAGRWKHRLCYSAPWGIDLIYSLWAKILKPHTILH